MLSTIRANNQLNRDKTEVPEYQSYLAPTPISYVLPNDEQIAEKTLDEKVQEVSEIQSNVQIETNKQVIDQLIKSSNRCVISISTSFPWTMFPNSINVEEGRVTFIFRQFLTSQSHSVDIRDISNVFIETSLFFATLQIVSKTFVQNDIKITKLSKKKAIEVRMIIEGLRTLDAHNINTSDYQVDELITKIKDMHSSQGAHIR